MDDEVVRYRLTMSEDEVVGLGKEVFAAMKSADEGAEDTQERVERALGLLADLRREADKVQALCDVQRGDARLWQQRREELEGQLEADSQEISSLQEELGRSTLQRRNWESYDALAVQIGKLPSRGDTLRALEREEEALHKVRREMERLEGEREMKSRQFSLVLSSVQNLRVDLQQGGSGAGAGMEVDEEMVEDREREDVNPAARNGTPMEEDLQEEEGELVQ